jgi:hypothetical protein
MLVLVKNYMVFVQVEEDENLDQSNSSENGNERQDSRKFSEVKTLEHRD